MYIDKSCTRGSPFFDREKEMLHRRPRIIMAALRGGSGKTVLSLGLIAAWREKGYHVAPFKKGPDFIDAGWLSYAAARPCHNLDPFLMSQDQILDSFLTHSQGSDVALIEGNRGLYDGLDIDGCCSTAELARLLRAPVLIIVDATMTTRTVAALVKGCQVFDPKVQIVGAILNRVAGSRQQNLITEAVGRYCQIPVVGSVPKLKAHAFPERHMGLVPYQERKQAEEAVLWAKDTVLKNLHVDEIWETAKRTEDLERPKGRALRSTVAAQEGEAHIGIIRDNAFWFYYPENLEQLKQAGGDLIEIDAISHDRLPPLDALYIGGGFPETQAQALAENQSFRLSLKNEIDKGLPVYAECGGLMYLGESLHVEGNTHPMVGALPVSFVLLKRPAWHGYTVLEVEQANPFYPVGTTLKGHEFHYSRAVINSKKDLRFAFRVNRGYGIDGQKDGLCRKNLLATYTHVLAAGDESWAEGLVQAARQYRMERLDKFSELAKKND